MNSSLWLQLVASFLSCWGFGVCLNVPKNAFIATGITGMAGYLAYYCHAGHSAVGASLVATIIIGIVALVFAHRLQMPVTIFTIPALMPLVPGEIALEALRALIAGRILQAQVLFVHMLMIAGAIAVGFMIAEIFAQYYSKVVHWRKK